jgi:hypothetical protein
MTSEEAYKLMLIDLGKIGIGIVDKIYDDFESRTCSNCKFCEVEYIEDATKYLQCINENSLLYMTSINDINDTHKDFGCNQWENKDD